MEIARFGEISAAKMTYETAMAIGCDPSVSVEVAGCPEV